MRWWNQFTQKRNGVHKFNCRAWEEPETRFIVALVRGLTTSRDDNNMAVYIFFLFSRFSQSVIISELIFRFSVDDIRFASSEAAL